MSRSIAQQRRERSAEILRRVTEAFLDGSELEVPLRSVPVRLPSRRPMPSVPSVDDVDLAEAERLLGEVLSAVQRGDLTADGPAAAALVRRVEGALIALRAQRAGPGQHLPHRGQVDAPP